MNTFEKVYSVFAILFAFGLMAILVAIPETRQLQYLLPISFIGLVVNVGLMFVVFRDVMLRESLDKTRKFIWLALLLLCWPAILFYLPLHGFRSRG